MGRFDRERERLLALSCPDDLLQFDLDVEFPLLHDALQGEVVCFGNNEVIFGEIPMFTSEEEYWRAVEDGRI